MRNRMRQYFLRKEVEVGVRWDVSGVHIQSRLLSLAISKHHSMMVTHPRMKRLKGALELGQPRGWIACRSMLGDGYGLRED